MRPWKGTCRTWHPAEIPWATGHFPGDRAARHTRPSSARGTTHPGNEHRAKVVVENVDVDEIVVVDVDEIVDVDVDEIADVDVDEIADVDELGRDVHLAETPSPALPYCWHGPARRAACALGLADD